MTTKTEQKTEEKTEPTKTEQSATENVEAILRRAFTTVQDRSKEQIVEAVESFARDLEGERSRKPPIHQRAEPTEDPEEPRAHSRSGDSVNVSRLVAMGDGRDRMYSRMRRGLSGDDLVAFDAARNPKADELAKAWATAAGRGDVTSRIRHYHEANDAYMKALGISRASLLEGSPTGENPLSDGSGAELLPLPLANQLMVERDKASVFRNLVNVVPMSAQTTRMPVLPTMAAATRAENAAYSDNTPTADAALLTATDLGVMFSAGRNFLEDTSFNIVNQLTVVAGGAIGAQEDVQIATSTGTGSSYTEGLDGATITDVPEATPSSIAFVDIVALFYAVPKQYRNDAVFFAASTTLSDLSSVVDGNGRPIFLNAVDAPRGMSDADPRAVGILYGRPIYDVPVADDVIYFGDPMWYALGQRAGIRVDTDREVTTGNRQWVIDQRSDGRVIPTSVVDTNNSWRKIVY